MKLIITFAVLMTSLFGFGEDIQSFEAHFTQSITDETGKVLTYKGQMHTKRPNFVLWNYTEPARAAKKLYMNEKRAVLVQPMLEQATISKMRSGMNFFTILSSAKRVDDTHFKATFENIDFTLKQEHGVIISLSYEDELENKIIITFSKQKQNRSIEDDFFTPKVPIDYDIIRP